MSSPLKIRMPRRTQPFHPVDPLAFKTSPLALELESYHLQHAHVRALSEALGGTQSEGIWLRPLLVWQPQRCLNFALGRLLEGQGTGVDGFDAGDSASELGEFRADTAALGRQRPVRVLSGNSSFVHLGRGQAFRIGTLIERLTELSVDPDKIK